MTNPLTAADLAAIREDYCDTTEERGRFYLAEHVPRLLATIDHLRAERDEALALLREWQVVESGCGGEVCNIGGGLCSDCLFKLHEVAEKRVALLAKLERKPT